MTDGSFPRTAAVVGLGLIGGSLALSLRAAGARVVGIDTSADALEMARRRDAVDEATTSLDGVAAADLVVVATPLDQVAQVTIAAARRMRSGSLLTDVGSVKAPIVAAVNGWALAGGLETALACDIRVASERAMFGSFEARRGFHHGDGGLVRLVNTCGVGVAMEMLLTAEPIDAQRALHAGARGYLFKSMRQHDLFDTIRAVHSGKVCVPPDITARIAAYQGHEVLTSRELEVLQRVADGGRNTEIATQLGIKEETVKAHVHTILAKLNARSRAHAVTIGISRGFIVGLSSAPT